MSEKEKRLEALNAILEVAWADGDFDEREMAFMEKLVPAFGLTPDALDLPPEEERKPLAELLVTEKERSYVYEKAYRMSLMDGVFSPREHEALERLREALHLSPAAAAVIEAKTLAT